MMKILPKLLLFLCAVALLLGLGLYAIGMKHTTNRTEITFMVKADSTGMVTPETRAMADSIVGVLTKDEQLLADKYQYVIDQQAKTQDFLAIGGILLGIIVSILGFFGYDKMQAIEDKAKDLAESSAKKAFSEELKELQQKHNQEYLLGTVKPTVSKEIEEAMVSFTDQKVAQIDEIEKKINLLEPVVAELNRRIKPQGTPLGNPSQPQPEPQPFGNKPVSKGGES